MLAIMSVKHKSDNMVSALPHLVGYRCFCSSLKVDLAPRFHSRQKILCGQWLLTMASHSSKKRWHILTRCVISKSAEDLTECTTYHRFSNVVENGWLSFVFDKHNMSMFIMWSPEDLLEVYHFTYLLFLCLANVNTGINRKVVTA